MERERSAVDICRFRFAALLLDMQRAIAAEPRDEGRIADLALEIVGAETALSCARLDLEEAEECA